MSLRPLPDSLSLAGKTALVTVSDSAILQGGIEMSTSEWNDALAMNLTTAFHATQAVVPFMREANWGRIINITSVSGSSMATRGDVGYAAAKCHTVNVGSKLTRDLEHEKL